MRCGSSLIRNHFQRDRYNKEFRSKLDYYLVLCLTHIYLLPPPGKNIFLFVKTDHKGVKSFSYSGAIFLTIEI